MIEETKKDWTEKVLNLLPTDGSEMQAKDIYANGVKNGISHITIERKLEFLSKAKSIKRRVANHKEVYYSRQENIRLAILAEKFEKEIIASLSQTRFEVQGFADFVSEEVKKKNGKGLTEETKKEIREDKLVVDEIFFPKLLESFFKMFRIMLSPKLKDEDFYIDSRGHTIPRALIEEKKINQSDIDEWRKRSNQHEKKWKDIK